MSKYCHLKFTLFNESSIVYIRLIYPLTTTTIHIMKTLTNPILNPVATNFTLNDKNLIVKPHSKLNFSFKRKFIILVFSFILSFGIFSQSYGQCSNYTWTDSSGCDWDIEFIDDFGNGIVASMTTATAGGGGTIPPSLCFGCNTTFGLNGVVRFTNACGCVIEINLLGGGVNSTIASDCAALGCTTISCSGSPSTTQISVTPTTLGSNCQYEYTIVIQ